MKYYDDAEGGIENLHPAARWPVWSALIVYRKILDAVAANGYDNITTRAYVPKLRKMIMLPYAYACAKFPLLSSKISRAVPF
jgi:phytoene synthase